MAWLRKNLAVDLGTTNVRVFTRTEGVKFQEPSVVALDLYKDSIVAVGEEAKDMLGRTPGNIVARQPLQGGVISNYRATEKMLRVFLQRGMDKGLLHPDVIITVPTLATQVQKRAVVQAASAAGAHQTFLIEAPLAAAMGVGVDIMDPSGTLLVDIGGGATDAALISAGGIVVSEAIPVAGDAMDAAIARFIRDKHHVMIGERTAETVKIRLGSVLDTEVPERVEVKGRNLADGLPARVYLTRDDLAQAIAPVLQKIADTVHRLLAETPPELSADLFDKGIILTGGGSLVRGLGPLIEEENGIRVRYAEQAVSCVVRGAGKALSWIRRFQATDAMLSDTTRQQTMNREILRKR